MQEQTQIGDKMKVDLDIGESEMLEVCWEYNIV